MAQSPFDPSRNSAAMGGEAVPEATVIEQKSPAYQAPIEHATLVEWFEDAEDQTTEARTLAERDRDYVDNKQYTAQELAAFEKRKQPAIIINRIKSKHQYLMGYEATQRSEPRGFPRTPNDEDAADACTDALRYVSDSGEAPQKFSQVWDNMLVEGYGGVEVKISPDGNGGGKIEFLQVHWDRAFYDPHSREHDFSDARYKGMVVWLDQDDAEARYPNAKDALAKTITESNSSTYDDRPTWSKWVSGTKRKRIRIVQMYYRRGSGTPWHWAIFTKGGIIEEGEVPYQDDEGNSLCPMIFQSAFVDRENARYGFVRQLIGPQDEINKRRQKALHLLMNRQTLSVNGAVDDVDRMKAELSKPDGHIVINPVDGPESFKILDTNPQISGNVELAQEAKNEIDLMGPNAALAGKQNQSASGRAVLASQQGGQIELANLMDRHKHFKHRVYKLVWAMIRQYWTAETWVRVTDNEDNLKFVGLNRPVTLAEDLMKKAEKAGHDMEQVKAKIKEQAANDPEFAQRLGQPTRTEHVPADMSMDIILDDVPDTANLQQEQFQTMAEMGKAGVVQFPPALWIKMSGLRNKADLLREINDQAPDPAKDAAVQAQLEKALKDIEKMNAEIDSLKAKTALDYAKAEQAAMDGFIQEPALLPPMQRPQQPQQQQAMPQQPGVEPQAMPSGPQPMQAPQALPEEAFPAQPAGAF